MAKLKRLRYGPDVTEALPLFLQPIQSLPGIRAAWIERVPGLEISGDRDSAMRTLRTFHETAVRKFSPGSNWWRAEQIHGVEIAVVPNSEQITGADDLPLVAGVDGLVTNQPGQTLAIYVADCGPIWLADAKSGAIGLLHSGKKGTEGNIFAAGLAAMERHFGTRPKDVVAVLGPCIRPPHYEIDFAAEIGRQALAAGIAEFSDCGLDTAADLDRFYSYRMEKGRTGRMMALVTRDF